MVNSVNKGFLNQHKTFFVLLLIGLLMRILFIEFQGLSNDELSAWYRTRFEMGEEFWKLGVSQGDMHPAFYQVVLWIWVRIFGDSEFSLRSTSLLFFIANLTLIYSIGRRFFSKYTGNLIAAFYASLGFLIINTTTARPYNSGVFFLLLAFYLILLLREKKSSFGFINTFWLFIAFFGAMTSHYFAFLSVGILGVCGLFYADKEARKYVFISGISAIVVFLFLHFSITQEQLSQGGLGWLSAPSFWWFIDFSTQLFQNSIGILMLGLGIIFFVKKGNTTPNSHQGFSLMVMFSISIVAYFISIIYTPILRELVFQFIIPFAFFGIVGPVVIEKQEGLSTKVKQFMPWLIVLVFSVHSIFVYQLFEPIHYGVFREIAENQLQVEKKYGKEKITYAQNTNNIDYLNYYLKDSTLHEDIKDWSQGETVIQLNKRVQNAQTPYFLYNWTNNYHVPMYLECIRRAFPRLARKKLYFNSGTYLYSRNLMDNSFDQRFLYDVDEGGLFEGEEFFVDGLFTVGDLRSQRNPGEYFLLEAKGSVESANRFYIVIQAEDENGELLMEGENAVMYWAYNQQELTPGVGMKEMFTAFELPKKLKNTDKIKIYCWNPDKGTILFNNLKLYAVK